MRGARVDRDCMIRHRDEITPVVIHMRDAVGTGIIQERRLVMIDRYGTLNLSQCKWSLR